MIITGKASSPSRADTTSTPTPRLPTGAPATGPASIVYPPTSSDQDYAGADPDHGRRQLLSPRRRECPVHGRIGPLHQELGQLHGLVCHRHPGAGRGRQQRFLLTPIGDRRRDLGSAAHRRRRAHPADGAGAADCRFPGRSLASCHERHATNLARDRPRTAAGASDPAADRRSADGPRRPLVPGVGRCCSARRRGSRRDSTRSAGRLPTSIAIAIARRSARRRTT